LSTGESLNIAHIKSETAIASQSVTDGENDPIDLRHIQLDVANNEIIGGS